MFARCYLSLLDFGGVGIFDGSFAEIPDMSAPPSLLAAMSALELAADKCTKSAMLASAPIRPFGLGTFEDFRNHRSYKS